MIVIRILAEVIINTPVYAWVILVLLVIRGRMASKDGVLCLPKAFIFPVIFIVWGLENVVNDFAFPWESILAYVVLAALGAPAGYALYKRFRSFYQKAGRIWRTGSYLPLAIMMANFLVKYLLNVALSIDPGLNGRLGFNLFYAVAGGFSVGLSLGGLIQAYKANREYGPGNMGVEH